MTAPDRDAIRAALDVALSDYVGTPHGYFMDAHAKALTPTVVALMEDYAADLRAEIERLRYAHHACDQERIHQMSRAEAAKAEVERLTAAEDQP